MQNFWHNIGTLFKSKKKFHLYLLILLLLLPLLVFSVTKGKIYVEKVSANTTLGIDVHVGKNQQAASIISSPVFSTRQKGEMIVVFLASDGPEYGTQAFSSVTGGGLTFTLAKRANAQAGTSEVWYAYAAAPLTNVVITANLSNGKYSGMIDVVSFTGSSDTLGGAAIASGSTGAPTVSLATTIANSWVWGIGNDWDRAVARKVGVGQSITRQFVNRKVGDTFWAQKQNGFTTVIGAEVILNDTAPTNDRWNLVAVEIIPQTTQPEATNTPAPTAIPTPTQVVTSPTPTPSTELQTNCQPNPSSCGYPDATNTGVPAGTALTKITGDMTINTAGAVIDGKDITGCVRVEAPGVTIKNTKITCTGYYGIFTASQAVADGAAPLIIQDVEIVCGSNSTGIAYANLNVRRAYIHGCENGFALNEDATVVDTYITDIKEVNGGHGDGMQFGGPVENIFINHNSIIVKDVTSAINWTDDTVSIVIENNLLAGGNYTIYCPRVAVPPGAFKVLNNRFGDFTYGHQNSCDQTGVIFTGNYEDSNLNPISAN